MKAQNWLDRTHLRENREKITSLMIAHERYRNDNSFHVEYPNYENIHYFTSEKTLSGILSLTRFFNLERLVIKDQEIDKLNLTQCSNLKELHARDNLIKTIILPNETSKLEMLDLTNNNILDHDLFYITNYTNLTYLHLGTDNVAKVANNIYNRWSGSLVYLCNLNFLGQLNINATDINDGLAYLPTDNLYYFTCGSMGRVNAGVEQIKEMLDLDEETAVSEDTDENWDKVGEIIKWKENQMEEFCEQMKIETPPKSY